MWTGFALRIVRRPAQGPQLAKVRVQSHPTPDSVPPSSLLRPVQLLSLLEAS